MRTILAVLMLLPFSAQAWDRINPNGRGRVYTTTTITDIRVSLNRRAAVRFAEDVVEGCRLAANDPNPGATYGTLRGHVLLTADPQFDRVMPVLLFARANNLQVQVVVELFNGVCTLMQVATCSDPQSCVEPPIDF